MCLESIVRAADDGGEPPLPTQIVGWKVVRGLGLTALRTADKEMPITIGEWTEDPHKTGQPIWCAHSGRYYSRGFHVWADYEGAREWEERQSYDRCSIRRVILRDIHTEGFQNGYRVYVGTRMYVCSAAQSDPNDKFIPPVDNSKEMTMTEQNPTETPSVEQLAEQILNPQPTPQPQPKPQDPSSPDPRYPQKSIQLALMAKGLSAAQADAVTQDMFLISGSDSTDLQLNAVTKELESLKEEVEEFRGQVEDLGVGDLVSECEDLRRSADDLSSTASDLESRASDLDSQCEGLKRQAEKLDNRLGSRMDDAEGTLADIKSNQEAILRILQRLAVVEDPDVVRERKQRAMQLVQLVRNLGKCPIENIGSHLLTLDAAAESVEEAFR